MEPRRPLVLFVAIVVAVVANFVSSAGATSVLPPTLDELVERSDSVVRARVIGSRCEWRGAGEDRRIVTVVTFEIEETIVGAPAETKELEFLGGELDGERMIVTGQTRFATGSEDILFVSREKSALTPLVRMMYGRYLVAKADDGQPFIARDNGVPLTSPEEVATTMASRPPGMVLAQIQAGRVVSPEMFSEAIRESARKLGRSDIDAK